MCRVGGVLHDAIKYLIVIISMCFGELVIPFESGVYRCIGVEGEKVISKRDALFCFSARLPVRHDLFCAECMRRGKNRSPVCFLQRARHSCDAAHASNVNTHASTRTETHQLCSCARAETQRTHI